LRPGDGRWPSRTHVPTAYWAVAKSELSWKYDTQHYLAGQKVFLHKLPLANVCALRRDFSVF